MVDTVGFGKIIWSDFVIIVLACFAVFLLSLFETAGLIASVIILAIALFLLYIFLRDMIEQGDGKFYRCFQIIMMFVCVVACTAMYLTFVTGYKEGNYSDHTCEALYCEKPADGGMFRSAMKDPEYYCKYHLDIHRNGYNKDEGSNFTNKYGSPTTKCAHAGCSKFIASSGDTNCCVSHSRKCLNCGCYIDEDAMYCMTYIKDALD